MATPPLMPRYRGDPVDYLYTLQARIRARFGWKAGVEIDRFVEDVLKLINITPK